VQRRWWIRVGSGWALGAWVGVRAQPRGPWLVGILDPGIPHLFAALFESMRALGYVERGNLRYVSRSAAGNPKSVPGIAKELVAARPDVIVTAGAFATRAVLQATQTVPVVVAAIGDAISAGIVRNLAAPDGNVTGLTFLNSELSAKRLELLREAFPRLRRVAVLNDVSSQSSYLEQTETAATRLGLQLHRLDVEAMGDLERAFLEAVRAGDEVLDVLASPFFNSNRQQLVQLAARHRLPAIYESREYALAGGFMTYGQDLAVLFRRAAFYVDRMLKGVRPAELPWEQPTKFEFVVNLRAARALGITVPSAVLLRADEVLE
jgi:putative tryptophan/tyrosine transport system substrate-binding protein